MAKDDIVDAGEAAGPSSDSFMTGLVVFTTLALAAAFIVIEVKLGDTYNRGMFAK